MPRCLTDAECERIARYCLLQTEALRAAATCKSTETRDAYKTIAAAWAKMIADIEQIAEHEEEPDDARDFGFMPPPERQRAGKALRK
jgi:hypothetical protein